MQIWPAPAKLNLFLHITGRRQDGYHLLQTVFQFLDFGDRLRFKVTEDGIIRRETPVAGVAEEADLCVRAARLLQQHTGCTLGADIWLDKRLPMGGGLGGGSSDAATTLLALNQLWALGLSRENLAGLALSLGADVPVFVAGHAAWAEGVGEQLTVIDLPERWYVVLAPDVQVSTAQVFRDPELTRNSPPIKIRDFHACLNQGNCRNDLEPVVRKHFPEVGRALDWLAQFGAPGMTGSGACVFLPVADQQAGLDILDKQPPVEAGFVAKGVNRHPILNLIN
ncbi:MAG: 4-(cytidine 5'-diphospho)-2-C-methyl-D-erythritol kinase [Gammaproteobacteria bacterium]|nr:4-(cytidine 5'-diphospho)-2-C-methyl-D-erythritol kinase [Gammaproteobacteria bacterium]